MLRYIFSIIFVLLILGVGGVHAAGCQSDAQCPPNSYCGPDQACKRFSDGSVVPTIDSTVTQPQQTPRQSGPAVAKVEGSKCTKYSLEGPSALSCPPKTICSCSKSQDCQGQNPSEEVSFVCWKVGCKGDLECGANGICDKGFCGAKSCSSDNDCLLGVCSNGSCVQNTTLVPPGPTAVRSASAGIACSLNGSDGVMTAIGCLPYDPVVLVNSLVTFLIGAAGGIALLLMATSAIQMMAQGSDAKALQSAQQRFVGAASGLLFIIFSVLILKVIGVNILQIPGFK